MNPAAPPADATDIAGALAWARARIDQMDARVLLRHVLQCPAARLVAWPEQTLATEDWAGVRRAAGDLQADFESVSGLRAPAPQPVPPRAALVVELPPELEERFIDSYQEGWNDAIDSCRARVESVGVTCK